IPCRGGCDDLSPSHCWRQRLGGGPCPKHPRVTWPCPTRAVSGIRQTYPGTVKPTWTSAAGGESCPTNLRSCIPSSACPTPTSRRWLASAADGPTGAPARRAARGGARRARLGRRTSHNVRAEAFDFAFGVVERFGQKLHAALRTFGERLHGQIGRAHV